MTTTVEPATVTISSVDSRRMRDGLRHTFGTFTTGVAVVTVGGEQPRGITVNSLASVSLDPPLVSVCIDRRAAIHDLLPTTGFAVSILRCGQEKVARWFADSSRPRGLAEFVDIPHRLGDTTPAPLLDGALAHMECQPWQCFDGGDHTIVTGEVLRHVAQDGVRPLTFFQGRFYDGPATSAA